MGKNFLKPSIWLLGTSLLLWGTAAWAETVEYDGLIEPYKTVELGAPSEGIVTKVKVDRGSFIKKGEVLVALDSSVEWAAVHKAKAVAAFAGEINLQQTQQEFAKRVHERIKQVGAISTHDKDQAATEIILTQHRLDKAREKQILGELELKKAWVKLAQRSIKSPLNGVVVERYVNPGEYVSTQPLLRIAQIDPLLIEVIIPAQMFGKISPDMTATIVPELPMYGEQTATVKLVDKVIDAASSTFGVQLELPNTELKIPSGLKCLVKFEIDAEVE